MTCATWSSDAWRASRWSRSSAGPSSAGSGSTWRPGVFVPRRRTEALVDLAVAIIVDLEKPVVVDLCCGTGAIGVAIAAS